MSKREKSNGQMSHSEDVKQTKKPALSRFGLLFGKYFVIFCIFVLFVVLVQSSTNSQNVEVPWHYASQVYTPFAGQNLQHLANDQYFAKQASVSPCGDNKGIRGFNQHRQRGACSRIKP